MDGCDGFEKRKKEKQSCLMAATEKRNRRGKRREEGWALPSKEKTEKPEANQSEREREIGQSEQGKEGKEGGKFGEDQSDPQFDPCATRTHFRRNFFIFLASCFKKSLGNFSITFPLSISPQIWRDLALKLDETARKGAAALASNCSIPKQFLSIATTHSFLLRPRTKPKHWLEHRSCYGGRIEHTHF